MQQPYLGEAKAGVQHSPKEGDACIQLDPLAGMNMRLGMRETAGAEGRSSTIITPIYPFLAFCSQKTAFKGASPHRQQLVAWLDTDLLHCRCVLQTRSIPTTIKV